MANKINEVLETAASIAKGMSVTLKEMMSPSVTENYPDEPPKLEERYRGVHVLQRDENGLEKCVACFLCAAACPSNCIYIEAAENTDTVRISGGERYAKVYNIDYNRCIFCGYCVEACPTDAITHGHDFEIASYNVSTLIYRKDRLLAPMPPGSASTRGRGGRRWRLTKLTTEVYTPVEKFIPPRGGNGRGRARRSCLPMAATICCIRAMCGCSNRLVRSGTF